MKTYMEGVADVVRRMGEKSSEYVVKAIGEAWTVLIGPVDYQTQFLRVTGEQADERVRLLRRKLHHLESPPDGPLRYFDAVHGAALDLLDRDGERVPSLTRRELFYQEQDTNGPNPFPPGSLLAQSYENFRGISGTNLTIGYTSAPFSDLLTIRSAIDGETSEYALDRLWLGFGKYIPLGVRADTPRGKIKERFPILPNLWIR